jgi:hypothetical protein
VQASANDLMQPFSHVPHKGLKSHSHSADNHSILSMNQADNCKDKDLLRSRWALCLLWVGPWVLIIATRSTSNFIHTIIWTSAFAVGGVACLVNARRCGRLHCFYTGPLYLLAALTSLLYGLGVLPLGPHGWNWIVGVAALLSLLACCGLEPLFGKYRQTVK